MGTANGDLSPDSRLAHTDKYKSRAQISNSWCRCKCASVQKLENLDSFLWDSRSQEALCIADEITIHLQWVPPQRRRPWFFNLDIYNWANVVAKKISFPAQKYRREWSSFPIYPMNVVHFRAHWIIHSLHSRRLDRLIHKLNRFLVWSRSPGASPRHLLLASIFFGVSRDNFISVCTCTRAAVS